MNWRERRYRRNQIREKKSQEHTIKIDPTGDLENEKTVEIDMEPIVYNLPPIIVTPPEEEVDKKNNPPKIMRNEDNAENNYPLNPVIHVKPYNVDSDED